MYKELTISIIIVVLIISCDIVTQNYSNEVINLTTDNLSELKDNISNGNFDENEVSERIDNIYDMWLEYHKKLTLYIEHDEIEKVETDFVVARSHIESQEYNLAISEIEKTVYVLRHISDKYEFNIENIF